MPTTVDVAAEAFPPVRGFHGPYWFLSNFAATPLTVGGVTYPTVEHAYQCAKTLDDRARAVVLAAPTPAAARARGQTVPLRPGWDQQRRTVMAELLQAKFTDARLAAWLLATGTGELVEVTTWDDRYWGVCDGTGYNHLGRLLMRRREELRAGYRPRQPGVRLAVVGSAAHCFTPHSAVRARQRISLALWRLRPQVVISGACPLGGVDIWAREVAGVFGYTVAGGDFIEHRPANLRWEPDGYKDRNAVIAADCSHLLRLRARANRTGGSAWTADRAEDLGAVVVRETL
jgi:N-glycosidase YbiA